MQEGKWKNVPPIWLTPNIILNGFFIRMLHELTAPTFKPFIIYNGHHRLDKAVEHKLPLKAYIRYTPGNPKIPNEEVLTPDVSY